MCEKRYRLILQQTTKALSIFLPDLSHQPQQLLVGWVPSTGIIDLMELTCFWRQKPPCNHGSTQQAHWTSHWTRRSEEDQYGSSGYYWGTKERWRFVEDNHSRSVISVFTEPVCLLYEKKNTKAILRILLMAFKLNYKPTRTSKKKKPPGKRWPTWAAPASCGPGWVEGFLSGRAPAALEADSRAAWSHSARCSSGPHTGNKSRRPLHNRLRGSLSTAARRDARGPRHCRQCRHRYRCLTFISISCMTSGKTSMELEWAMRVCIRRQFMMVVGTVFSMFPLRSTSSSSSSLAILLWGKGTGWAQHDSHESLRSNTFYVVKKNCPLSVFEGSWRTWWCFSLSVFAQCWNK